MPRQLALLLCLLFSAYLLRRDIKDRPTVSSAIWIPTLWLMIIGSRPVTLWFSGGVIDTTSGYYAEGSPLDRAFYLACIFAAFAVLRARGTNLVEVMAANKTIVLFYLYLGLTVLWSDIPFPSFKRWFKDLGNVVVILVILTEKDPYEAMRAVFARCACVLIPLSVVFIKYFPDLGRDYSKSGGQMVTGVTLQ